MTTKQRYTQEQVAAALKEKRGMIMLAGDLLGCSNQTMHAYLHRYPALRKVIDDFSEKMVDTGELKLWDAIEAGDAWAVQFVLKTKGKNRGYVERVEQEITGRGGGAIEVKAFEYGTAITAIAPRPMDDSEASGADKGDKLRSSVGENPDVR